MVQDAPLSPTPLPVSLLIDLVKQVPQVQYAKIEVPQAADKLHALVTALGILLAEGGIIASDRTRAPFAPVSPGIRRGLIELAARRDPLIMRWAR